LHSGAKFLFSGSGRLSATERLRREVSVRTLSGAAARFPSKKDKTMKIEIKDDFIKLGQAMKLAGLVDEGVEAKYVIQNGEVSVNGDTETRRGRKLVPGDRFCWKDNEVEIMGSSNN